MIRCYACSHCGKQFEAVVHNWRKNLEHYKCECGKQAERDLPAEQRGYKHAPGNWPMKSEALGVQPDQVDAAKAEAAKLGIPTDFTKDGKAIFTSPSHFKRYAEAHGYYAKNAGYSDPQRGASKVKWF